MNPILESINHYWHIWIIGVLLCGGIIGYCIGFIIPSRRLKKELQKAIKSLEQIKSRSNGRITDLDEIAKEAMSYPKLSHSWSEYTETLHPQKEVDELAQLKVVRWRSTALAEIFFTEQAIVDTPLEVEYYKHLPGILTGLGIIGTFSGLIFGLMNFEVSSNPAIVSHALEGLIQNVGHAFKLSAIAIILAMLVTWHQKSRVAKHYGQVEELCRIIDSLFGAVAGEEYLERLVKASETSATQTAHIKDSLVADLKQILSDIATKQIEASAQHSRELSVNIAHEIKTGLNGPMEKISSAVKGVSSNQGEAVNKLLTDVLAGFASQMKEIFGGQMQGMSDLLMQTTRAMQATVEKFDQLTAKMDAAGKGAADAMAERLKEAMTSMEGRQQILNRQMQETLTKLGDQVVIIVAHLNEKTEATIEDQQKKSNVFAQQTQETVLTLSGQMEKLIAQSLESSRSLQASVSALTQTTIDAINRMNSSAETLYLAANEFAKAGQGVAETMDAASEATGKIQLYSQSLMAATGSTRQMLEDYKHTRDTFALMVSELKSTVENARKEASMTADLIGQLKTASIQIGTVQRQAEDYLRGVSEVLAKAHESFAENIERTLRKGNSEFHSHLTEAVNLLSGGIQDLGDLLENVSEKRQ